jgi:hypothetical protein
MTAPAWPNQDCPVYISAPMPGDGRRVVQVMRLSGEITRPEGRRDHNELRRLVDREHPGTDLDDPDQVYWVDHPGAWPQA